MAFLHADVKREIGVLLQEVKDQSLCPALALKVCDALLRTFQVHWFVSHWSQKKEYRSRQMAGAAAKFAKEISLREKVVISKEEVLKEFRQQRWSE